MKRHSDLINLHSSVAESQKTPPQKRDLNLAADLLWIPQTCAYINPTDTWHIAGVLRLFRREFVSGSRVLTRARTALLGAHARSFFMCALILSC